MFTDTWPESPAIASPAVDVDTLLAVDRQFRASHQEYFHTEHAGLRFSAFHSRSAVAQRVGRTRDWVVIEAEVPGPNPHWTVVTEWRGVMKGKRVVRGRETECFAWHRRHRHRRSLRISHSPR